MRVVLDKNRVLDFLIVVILTIAAAMFITSDGFATKAKETRLSDLSDIDIDMILAVKNEMYESKIRAN